MKTKRAGLLTKLVVLALLIATSIALLNLRAQLVESRQQEQQLTQLVDAKSQENQALAAAISGKDDPDRVKAIAREKLGLVVPGEIIFYDAAH
ncbi:MAG: septum formation initiator family protein [Oscillospiraceae bacterium]